MAAVCYTHLGSREFRARNDVKFESEKPDRDQTVKLGAPSSGLKSFIQYNRSERNIAMLCHPEEYFKEA